MYQNRNNRDIIASLGEAENMKSNVVYIEEVGFLGFYLPLFV